MEKLCVFCKHWYFDGGSEWYSEMTPGSNATIMCGKGRWKENYSRGPAPIRLHDIYGADKFRELIKKAETCQDYEQVTT